MNLGEESDRRYESPEAALGAEAPGPSPRPFLPNSTEHPMPWLSKLSQSCRPALPTRAWARCCDPSQAGVGLHSTSRQGPRAPRWQLCGQLNGSSVPFLALHLLQEAPALTLGGGAQKSHPQDRDQEQQQRRLLGGWQDKHLPGHGGPPSETRPAFAVASRSREKANHSGVGKLPLPGSDTFAPPRLTLWVLYSTLMCSL